MIKKKRGSTLVTTIISFGALLTVGTAMLSMSLGDYKMRISQNNRIMNLYGSESGLDVAYDILVKDFDTAAQFGAFKAKQLEVTGANPNSPYKKDYTDLQAALNDLNDLNDYNVRHPDKPLTATTIDAARKSTYALMEDLKNKEFRRSFKIFLYVPTAANFTEEYTPNQLKASLEVGGVTDDTKNTRYYFDGISKVADPSGTGNITPPLTTSITSEDFFDKKSIDLVSNSGDSEPQITVEPSIYPLIETEGTYTRSGEDDYNKNYEIRINSTFRTVTGNAAKAGDTNMRTVQTIYNLKIPNYNDVVFGDSTIQEHSIYRDKGLTIGGNMKVDGTSTTNLTVNGDIFVQGSNSTVTSLDNKYNGGITLNNMNNILFNGTVVIGQTFNIGKNITNATIGNATLKKNLYAGNVYAGMTDGTPGDSCNLTVSGDVVVDNDLSLKATNTNITTNNFYGINSERIEDSTVNKTTKLNGGRETKLKNSSSIIVNQYNDKDGNDPSSITINNEALIMGVAYINTQNGYATGESVGVKGNYNAYSQTVDSDNNLTFDANHDQDSPLYLINGTVIDKNTHFYDYWSKFVDTNGKFIQNSDNSFKFIDETNTPISANSGGVHFGDISKIFSVGSIVNSKVNDYTLADHSIKDIASSQVKKGTGSIETLQTQSQVKQKEYALRVYDMDMSTDITKISTDEANGLQALYSDPSSGKTVDSLMNFPSTGDATLVGNVKDDFGVFNPNLDREIVINQDDTITDPTITGLNDTQITISAPSNKPLKAFIATNGKITINGSVTINGNIIAKGDLVIQGIGDKTITYDEDLASRLQLINSGIFEQVFGLGDVTSDSTTGVQTDIAVQYDLPKFLKTKLWSLVK
jgi:hypothetical protein